MVTLPSEAAEDEQLVEDMILAGMDIARINLSHDDPDAWKNMVRHVENASKKLHRNCRIYMDLAGPKIRTGDVEVRTQKKKKKPIDYILLKAGELLELHRNPVVGRSAKLDKKGAIVKLAKVSVQLPEVFDFLEAGHRILFDDGKIAGVLKEVGPEKALVEITQVGIKGGKLRAGKGINFPDSYLKLPSLTDADLENIPFVVKYADIVGYSFVQRASDVRKLQKALAALGGDEVGLVLKIETAEAFRNLPELLLTGMRSKKVGVMVARGDLAVELGFERISEVQEQILWICEAAHVPVIWATQVLEDLAKKGLASRAEITDAAMSVRAECVMLNKGPYILLAMRTLLNILERMQPHQAKRKGTLRPLHLAQEFLK